MQNEITHALDAMAAGSPANEALTRLSPGAITRLVRWFGKQPSTSARGSAQRALEVLAWCEQVGNDGFSRPDLAQSTYERATQHFGVSTPHLLHLFNSYPELLRGKLEPLIIAIEGVDGAGKATQAAALADALSSQGLTVRAYSFPDYSGFFGKRIGHFLSGGGAVTASSIDAHSMCLWYALDRWKAISASAASSPDILLFNRYTLSSAVYQGARVLSGDSHAFMQWVFDLEHAQLGLPIPDLYFILDAPPSASSANLRQKGVREYIEGGLDVYEESASLLTRARELYLAFADSQPSAIVVRCASDAGAMRPASLITTEILEHLEHAYGLSRQLE